MSATPLGLACGLYRTAANSTVRISGKHAGIYEISFDFLGEDGACVECEPYVSEGELRWCCNEHSGRAALFSGASL